MTTIRLVNGEDELALYPRDDAELLELDLGYPELRESVVPYADTSGTVDSTRLYGSRVVSCSLALFDTPLASLDEIRRFTAPSQRPYLHIGENEWDGERRILVRAAGQSLALEPGLRDAATVQLQWKAPLGVFEAAEEDTTTFGAAGGTVSAGMSFAPPVKNELLTATQRTNTGSATGWYAGTNTILGWTGTLGRTDVGAVSLTAIADGAISGNSASGSANWQVAVGGRVYYVSGYFRADTIGRTCRFRVTFYNAAGTSLGTFYSFAANPSDTATDWTYNSLRATAPTGSASMVAIAEVLNASAGEVHYLDDLSFYWEDYTNAGLNFPEAFPIVANTWASTVPIDGSVPVHWTARLYGPYTSPRLTNMATGHMLYFPGLTIAAGTYLELNSLARTAYANGSADASRLSYLDFVNSAWWQLQPGDNELRFQPDSIGAGAQAQIVWRQAWL